MKDSLGPGERAEVCRSDLYDEYVKSLELSSEGGPCRDPRVLSRAAQYLRGEPEPTGTFSVFPFYQALTGGLPASGDRSNMLTAFIRATELLETLCVNLILQPWRKEIQTLKTFTGPFVYCILPVFSTSTIQSVLASIGYVQHTDAQQCEFRLSEDANSDRAKLVGFELLLARVECFHLLELLEKNPLGPQEWLEVLQRRMQPSKVMEHTETRTATGQKEDEEAEKNEEMDKEGPLQLDPRLPVNPQPKPRRSHLFSADHSIMEMQREYPDLAIRGRPLIPDKPSKLLSGMSSSKPVPPAELSKNLSSKGIKAAATATLSRNDGVSVSGGSQDPSLPASLRAGWNAELNLEPGEPRPTAEPVWLQHQSEPPNKVAKSEFSSMSSVDQEKQDLKVLDEMMGQLRVQDDKEEGARREDKRGEQNTSRGRRRNARKTSTEGEAEEKNGRKQSAEPREPQLTAGPLRLQQHHVQSNWTTKGEFSSMTSIDQERLDLRQLAQRMGQPQEDKEEGTRKDDKRGTQSTSRHRRRNSRKTSTEGEAEEKNGRKQSVEISSALIHSAGSPSRWSQYDQAKQQQWLTEGSAAHQNCVDKDASRGEQEGNAEEAGFVVL
ncbi:uncharacterized protein KZ484_011280 [Pholidichthys leucotaenia]